MSEQPMPQADTNVIPVSYSFSQFEKDMEAFKPRMFDTYILPGFLIGFAMLSGKKKMGRTARRMLFVAGIYMFYRNYAQYKQLVQQVINYEKTPSASA